MHGFDDDEINLDLLPWVKRTEDGFVMSFLKGARWCSCPSVRTRESRELVGTGMGEGGGKVGAR